MEQNKTLSNGLRLLEHLASTADAFPLTAIAEALQLPKSHVHRLLQTLLAQGYVLQDERRRYHIGYGPLRLSCQLLHNMRLRQSGLPYLDALAEDTHGATILSVPQQGSALIVATRHYRGLPQSKNEVLGNVLHAHGSASGKLFLAHADAETRQAAYTELDFDSEFINELEALYPGIIDEGIAVHRNPQMAGHMGFAATVYAADGSTLGGIGVAMTPESFQHCDQASCMAAVKKYAQALSFALGHVASR